MSPSDGDVSGGVDVKYGITNGLTLDATVNTDFSQVEADEQQVNLTRFSVLFPEKRDFFLENSGIFQFGLPSTGTSSVGGASPAASGRQNSPPDARLFFSRQIGLSDAGAAIPILAGSRVTGRAGAYSVGALNIQQREQGPVPSTNFTAIRVQRAILANSDVGMIFLNKDAERRRLQPGRRRRREPALWTVEPGRLRREERDAAVERGRNAARTCRRAPTSTISRAPGSPAAPTRRSAAAFATSSDSCRGLA